MRLGKVIKKNHTSYTLGYIGEKFAFITVLSGYI